LLHCAGKGAEFGDSKFLGARGRRDLGRFEQRLHRDPEGFETSTQHFTPLAKGGGGDAFECGSQSGSEGLGPREDVDDTRCHLGRRDEGAGGDIKQNSRLRKPLQQHREPAIRLAAGRCGKALGDLPLEHQGQALIFADPLQPTKQQQRGDIVGQIGDNFARWIRERHGVEPERVCGMHLQALGIRRRELTERCKTPGIAFNRDDAAGTRRQQCPRQTPGTRADLDDSGVVEPSGGARDPACQIEVEEKVLTEAFASDYAMLENDLAQWRQRGWPRPRLQAVASRFAAISAASRSAAMRLSGRAVPRPARAKAVP
jgi:hypothetical protein